MKDIQDFGEKIGGARKDMWAGRGLIPADLLEMNASERLKYIKKDNVWPRPDWAAVIRDGTPLAVAYWQNEMRKALPPTPVIARHEKGNEAAEKAVQENYVQFASTYRDSVMAVKTEADADAFFAGFLNTYTEGRNRNGMYMPSAAATNILNAKMFRLAQVTGYKLGVLEKKAIKSGFGLSKDVAMYETVKRNLKVYCYDGESVTISPQKSEYDQAHLTIAAPGSKSFYYGDNIETEAMKWQLGTYFVLDEGSRKMVKGDFSTLEEANEFVEYVAKAMQEKEVASPKSTSNRKKAFSYDTLETVGRTGTKYLQGERATGEHYLEDMHFKGGEFGNWVSPTERQQSLDMGYLAFRDLARVLEIKPEDVSLDGQLSIAFGARGKGGMNAASAHYEAERQVINLTKMSGAGCLAHEWGHALDDYIGRCSGIRGTFASEAYRQGASLPALTDVMTVIMKKSVPVEESAEFAAVKKTLLRREENLDACIQRLAPKNMTVQQAKSWQQGIETIAKERNAFTGLEYAPPFGGISMPPADSVEALSVLRKSVTGKALLKNEKKELAYLSFSVARQERTVEQYCDTTKGSSVMAATDYLNGSKAFDSIFAKQKHGYWASPEEMFARAFDCYIADKLSAAGEKSQYLTAHANSFVFPQENGELIYAVPMGEERKVIFEKMDVLMADIKERGWLHDFVEPAEPIATKKPSLEEAITNSLDKQFNATSNAEPRQISFDDFMK